MSDSSVPPPLRHEPPRAAPERGFFGWVRSLGIVRSNGWIGGVAAGFASRFGIDPIIVRGIFVVVALLGAPALFVYALAWALLPDEHGVIHFQNLLQGRIDPPMIAAGIIVVIGVVPIVPVLLGTVLAPFSLVLPTQWSGGGVSVLLALLLIALVVTAIVVGIRRRNDRIAAGSASAPSAAPFFPPTSAGPQAGPTAQPSAAPWAAEANAGQPVTTAMSVDPDRAEVPAAGAGTRTPAAPASSASTGETEGNVPAAEFAQWRQQHENLVGEHEAWRAAQADAEQAAKARAIAERSAAIAERNRLYDEARAVRRATKPRTSFGYICTVVGIAAIAAAATALALSGSGARTASAAALFVAAATCALGMLVAGILRRRSGFLAAVTIIVLAIATPVGVPATFTGGDPQAHFMWPGGAYIAAADAQDQRYIHPAGSTGIFIPPPGEGGTTTDAWEAGMLTLEQGVGETSITVPYGVAITLSATTGTGTLTVVKQSTTDGDDIRTIAPISTGPDGNVYEVNLSTGPKSDRIMLQPLTVTQHGAITVYLEPDWNNQ